MQKVKIKWEPKNFALKVMNPMYKCVITVFLPLRKVGELSPLSFEIAKYDFDPGLYPEDIVYIHDASFFQTKRNEKVVEGDEQKFSFEAQVLRRRKIIEPGVPKDSFTLLIELEIADKEQMPEIVRLCKTTFAGQYEDYELEVKSNQD